MPRIPTHYLVLASLLAMLSASPLAAQGAARHNRSGFWGSVSVGSGSARFGCTGCGDELYNGVAVHLRLGGTVNHKVLLGGESSGWINTDPDIEESITNGSFILLWYPTNRVPLYLKFGVGGLRYSLSDGVVDAEAWGPSGTFGLGYEFRVARNLYIVPYADVFGSTNATIRFTNVGTRNPGVDFTVYQLGVGITWH